MSSIVIRTVISLHPRWDPGPCPWYPLVISPQRTLYSPNMVGLMGLIWIDTLWLCQNSENDPVEIVDLPIDSMVIVQFVM